MKQCTWLVHRDRRAILQKKNSKHKKVLKKQFILLLKTGMKRSVAEKVLDVIWTVVAS